MNQVAPIAVAHAGAGVPCWRSPTLRSASRAPAPRPQTTAKPEDTILVVDGYFSALVCTSSQSARSEEDAYGTRTVTTAGGTTLPKSTIGFQRGFTGYQLDEETGLYYARNRMYSSQLGRFVSRDPMGYVDGFALYCAYFVPGGLDPSGLINVQHHWFPQAFKLVFEDICGATVDDFTTFMPEKAHQMLHFNYNYNWVMMNVIRASVVGGKVDCCKLFDLAQSVAGGGFLWLRDRGWFKQNEVLRTHSYVRKGDTGRPNDTTERWDHLQDDCNKKKPCDPKEAPRHINLQSVLSDWSSKNPFYNADPAGVEQGPYGMLPGANGNTGIIPPVIPKPVVPGVQVPKPVQTPAGQQPIPFPPPSNTIPFPVYGQTG